DTVKAMGDIAQHVLAVIRAVKPWFTTVAITGSNGKTTTKELIRTLCTDGWLALERRRVHATPGNFNNFIGVPLTLFALRWGHDVAVLEVGTSAFGEIRRLVEIVQPDVRVLTSVSTAHLDGLGDEAGVLRAKGELFEGMKPADVALMEASLWERLTEANLLDDAGRCGLFGLPAAIADARASGGFEGMSVTAQRSEEEGALALACVDEGSDPLTWRVEAPLVGDHNDANLAGALAAMVWGARRLWGEEAAVTTRGGAINLSSVELPAGRLAVRQGVGSFGGVTLVDDCYNANPGSMRAGIAVLVSLALEQGGRPVAVLGDMFELGDQAELLHKEVGRNAAEAGVALVVGFGTLAAQIVAGVQTLDTASEVRHVAVRDTGAGEAVDGVLALLTAWVKPGDVVLVKGSRGMRMERIVQGMTTATTPQDPTVGQGER
ncbi:MAG: UDP-N-acetylmuramoyl-tripeptide--D-alanyl-D-alanine ligase, partial [Myxococcota bacterium]